MNIINDFSLIICTYNREKRLDFLLESVENQILKPREIIIVDSSDFINPRYQEFEDGDLISYKWVSTKDRGLTKQRNIGIKLVHEHSNVICFLDDDVILNSNYFQELMSSVGKREDMSFIVGVVVGVAIVIVMLFLEGRIGSDN